LVDRATTALLITARTASSDDVKAENPDAQRARRRSRVVLLAVICAALVVAIGYNVWLAQQNTVKPYQRTAADFIVTWRCLACQHEQDGRADIGPHTCPKCGKDEMYVCIRHGCPQHGVFPVAFQYDDSMNPIRLKVAGESWVPYADEDFIINARCPRCGQVMLPAETPRAAPAQDSVPG
jgi:predicted RNA-binding Zn-ribbon protein involved in translation (DUF1610 family)